jgi:hypothetical protein
MVAAAVGATLAPRAVSPAGASAVQSSASGSAGHSRSLAAER